MDDQQEIIRDLSGYDFGTLTEWYIQLRGYKTELNNSIKPALEHTTNQMDAIEAEFNRRINEQPDITSIKTTHGTVTRIEKSSYKVVDKFAFREWIIKNPDIGVQLITAAITPAEVSTYVEDGHSLPDGIASEKSLTIQVRKS